jgi:hypothetical protein
MVSATDTSTRRRRGRPPGSKNKVKRGRPPQMVAPQIKPSMQDRLTRLEAEILSDKTKLLIANVSHLKDRALLAASSQEREKYLNSIDEAIKLLSLAIG